MVQGEGPVLLTCMWMFSFPESFVKKTILYHGMVLAFLLKRQLTVYGRVCFWDFSSGPLVCVSVFMPHCFDNCSFVIRFFCLFLFF